MYKKGKKLEEAGLSYEAANFYIDAIKRNGKNSDAIIALKKTGQVVLDDFYSKFYQFYADGKHKDAVYAYLDADNFKIKVERLGVRLESAPYYANYYKEVKEVYIKELYVVAQQDLDNENFAGAEVSLQEIQKLEPSYKDVEKLKRFAFVEPRYRMALVAYDNYEYRKAYYLFEEIINNGGDYKESKVLKDISQENAQYTVGFLKFTNNSNVAGAENAISGAIISNLMRYNDPFLKVLDRSITDKIISEQRLGMSGIVDEKSAAKAGALLGAKAIVIGTVSSSVKNNGKLRKQSKTGYLGRPVTKTNKETGKKYTDMVYSKVYYYSYNQKNSVSCTFQYQLISAETGEVLLSDVITKTMSDKISYSTFNGDSKYLYSGTWISQTKTNKNDKIYNSYSAKRELNKSLKGKQEIKTANAMADAIYREIASAVAIKIKNYNPEG